MDDAIPLPFRDRRDAGRCLVPLLARHRGRADTVVLGLPRGGVVPAAEVAAALDLPLDVLLSRKLGAPGNPELAIGAVAEGGPPWLDHAAIRMVDASPEFVSAEVARQRAEIDRRRQRFRGGRPLALPPRATVLLVDDGVATGATAVAGIQALRRLGVAHVAVVVPVAPPDTAALLRRLADELVVLVTPDPFYAVGLFYADFRQVEDDAVAALLAARRAPA
jgi:putative phosphoribosyl transferase